jgi:hypothetical protein
VDKVDYRYQGEKEQDNTSWNLDIHFEVSKTRLCFQIYQNNL